MYAFGGGGGCKFEVHFICDWLGGGVKGKNLTNKISSFSITDVVGL
jgi:hypothetical protein